MHLKNYAIVCLPSDTVAGALRMAHLGDVDVPKTKQQHLAYCQALEHLGFSLIQMPPDERYPDSVFVEDPAVIIEDTLVITRLRRQERRGEEKRIEQALKPFFRRVLHIEEPGFIEGGDVLVTANRLYIGLSERTNAQGAEQLARIARDRHGYTADIFEIPEHYLHLKGGVSYHRNVPVTGSDLITVSEEIVQHFSGFGSRLIVTPGEERFGANGISAGDEIFIHTGRTKTRQVLEAAGLLVHELGMSEFEKIDGALSCLSKLFVA